MGNSRSNRKRTSKKPKVVKRTIKFLSVAPDSNVAKAVLQKAPAAVIRAIANAALKTRQGAVAVPPHLKQLFRHNNHHFDYLIDRTRPIALKHRLVLETGGALPKLYRFWPRFLVQLAPSLFLGYYAKMTSSFSIKVLFEQAQLDRPNNGNFAIIHLNYKQWLDCKTK